MTRWRASGLHLLFSCAIAACVVLMVVLVWYPGAFFQASGAARLITVLISVDVVMGPLLTLYLYRAGKPGLAIDMTFVFTTQLAALIYGLMVIIGARPVFLVAAIDRFVVISANQVDPADLPSDPNSPYHRLSLGGPVRVGLKLPEDIKDQENLLFKELAGKASEAQPRLFVPYEQAAPELIKRGHSIEQLRTLEERKPGELQRWLDKSAANPADLLWVPLSARKSDMVVILDRRSAEPLVTLDIQPW